MSFIYGLLLDLVFLLNEIQLCSFWCLKAKTKSSWEAKCFMLWVLLAVGSGAIEPYGEGAVAVS